MTWRYTRNQATKDTAESLLKKLRPLSDKECMDVIREVQTNYHLPDKARTIGEMLAEARQQSGAAKLAGHDIMALERFDMWPSPSRSASKCGRKSRKPSMKNSLPTTGRIVRRTARTP